MWRKLLYILSLLSFISSMASCAKQPNVIDAEQPQKIKKDPMSETYLQFMQSELERYVEKPVASLETINKIIEANPDVGYFFFERAIINAGTGNWETVANDCKETLERDPKNIDAKILYGQALGVQKQHDKAIKYLEEARREAPDREDIYPVLAKEYLNVENYRQAERVMLDLLARDSESLVAYYYLGAIYGAYLKQPVKAISIYMRLLEREPENVQVIDAVAHLYLEMGQPRKALEMLLALEKQKPADVSVKLKIARIYYKLKDYTRAIEEFEEVLKRNPDSDKLMYYLGVLYEEISKFPEAILMYERVPPVSGLYKDARIRLAYRYKTDGQDEKAKSVLLEGIRKKPEVPEFYQYLAGIDEKDGDYKGAIDVLMRATKVFPAEERLFFALGTLYERMGDVKKAIEMMRKVLKINPENSSAMNYIGYTYVDRGENFEEAEDLLQKAIQLKPEDGFIIDSLGWLYFKKGDFTKAFQLLKRAIELVPDEPTILKHMGQVYLQMGENDEAIKYFNKALKLWQQREVVNKDEVNEIVSLIQKAIGSKQ